MTMFQTTLAAAILAAALTATAPASALGLKDCSDKYSAAKTGGTLGGKTWAEFRKAECGPDAKPLTPAATAPTAAPAPAAAAKPAAPTPAPAAAAKPVPAPAVAGSAVFPSAVSDAHKSEKPSKARFNTCLDQYRINKTSNGNGGMKWIQKGGGYYSECNKRLKA